MAAMAEVVDLTLDSDEEQKPVPAALPAAKRQRLVSSKAFASEVEVVQLPAKVQAPLAEGSGSQDQDEVVITGDSGMQVWNKDMAHMRHQCGNHPFDRSSSAANVQACSHCFCFVCDVKSSECKRWGDGTGNEDHCNAYDSQFWKTKKAGRPGGSGVQATRIQRDIAHVLFGSDSEDYSSSDEDGHREAYYDGFPHEAYYDGFRHEAYYDDFRHYEQPPRVLAPLPRLEPLPNANPAESFLLGTVRLEAKAVGGKPIAGLQEKVVRWGAYSRHGRGKDPDKDKVHIQNLTDHLTLLPFECSLPPVPKERTVAVTIVHCDGSAAPMTYGLEMPSSSSRIRDLAVKAFQSLGKENLRDFEWMHFSYDPRDNQSTDYHTRMGRLRALGTWGEDETISEYCRESQHKKLGIMLLAYPGAPCKPVPSDPAVAAARTRRIVCFHRVPDSEGVHQVQGIPTVFNVDSAFASGGTAQSHALKHALLQSVRPYKCQGKEASFTSEMLSGVLRAQANGTLVRKMDKNYYRHPGNAAKNKPRYKKFSETEPPNGKYVYVCVVWKTEAKGVLDFQQLPAVDVSATPQKLQETYGRIKAETDRSIQIRDLLRRPAAILRDITRMQSCSKPDNNRFQDDVPLLRVSMELEPKGGEADQGTVIFQLWAWKTGRRVANNGQLANGTLFDGSAAERHSDLLQHLLKDHPGVAKTFSDLRHWREDRQRLSDRSLPGFLKNLESGEMEAAPQPAGLTVAMRPYQLQSLGFMQRAELTNGNISNFIWHEIRSSDGTVFWYSPALGEATLTKPQPGPWGGFLCETMGLGKTIEVLALVLGDRPHLPAVPRVLTTVYPVDHPLRQTAEAVPEPETAEEHQGRVCSNATLVICAVSLVGQWVDEASNKSAGSLRMYQYHGANRIRNVRRLATEYDIVVTTYATLSKDYLTMLKKGASNAHDYKLSPLHGVHWYRIVLDESHTTKSSSAGHTKACMALEAERRWCCSGTPVATSIDDLYGQCCVLRTPLLSSQTFFNNHFKLSFGRGYGVDHNTCLLYYYMSKMMVRHTKNQQTGGETVLQLPPLHQTEVAVTFGASELELYNRAHSEATNTFREMADYGSHHVSKHLLQIMSLLLPMRRIASGGELSHQELTVPDCTPRRRKEPGENLTEDSSLVVPRGVECPICLDVMDGPTVTPCAHWFCKECLLGAISETRSCPLCRTVLQHDTLRVAVAESTEASTSAAPPTPEGPAAVCDSKLQSLLSELTAVRSSDGSAKALVFSQYMSTIEWLKKKLPENGFSYRTISGGMPLKQRAKAIGDFQKDPPTTVFLLSMRAGAVGINLTAASHVFLLEPALNPALEEQAIGRAWRMGQTRAVVVKRFFVKDSVEENIMRLVKRKQTGPQAGAASSSKKQQNLAGNLHADRQDLKLAELELLFARHPPKEDSDAAVSGQPTAQGATGGAQ